MSAPFLNENKWYVIVAKTMYQKKLSALLEKLGMSFYLPIQRQLHYWSDRKKWIDVPILAPYLFLFSNEKDRRRIFETGDLFHFLRQNGQLTTVKEEEIEKIKLLCNYAANVKIESNLVKKGDKVEIIGGPLSGMKGYALQENGRHRFLIQVLGLGQFASVEIDSNWVRIVN